MEISEIREQCASCENCQLCKTRTNLVFGTGNEHADIMLIGEGPGEKEDLAGEPFVGPAGKLLDLELELIGLDRTKVYIANIVKCRPPMNRDPLPQERVQCRKWLDMQIEAVNPEIIVCLGRISATSLIDEEFKITREHGQWFYKNGRKYIATYHPSALLRDESKRPEAFEDLVKIRAEYEHNLS